MYIRWLIRHGGKSQALKWDNGNLSGDRIAVARLRASARVRSGENISPPTFCLPRRRYLRDPYATMALANLTFDDILDVQTNVRPQEDTPGAVN